MWQILQTKSFLDDILENQNSKISSQSENVVPILLTSLYCVFFVQDLGMESTSLDDVLYRYASFRNLVDPITHDLIISLAKYIHCPKV